MKTEDTWNKIAIGKFYFINWHADNMFKIYYASDEVR